MYLLTARATVRIFSYGGGVQSNAVLALQAMGKLPNPYDVFVFSNVGDDSENPDTLRYINEVAKPFAEKHGVKLIEARRVVRGKQETLKQYLYRTEKSITIPAYGGHNGTPAKRICTADFKIGVVDKHIKVEDYPYAVVGLGISLDEFHRMNPSLTRWYNTDPNNKKKKLGFWKRLEYPLIDQRITRQTCKQIINDAGLPIAPKSSCYFCPYTKRAEWIAMKRNNPELFAEAVKIDNHLREKRGEKGAAGYYLHRDAVPLENAVSTQLSMFTNEELDICESGYCFA